MVVLIFLQIISRVIIGSSFSWTEELARFLMIWVTLLGGSFAFQYGAHIGIEVLVRKLPRMTASVIQVIVTLACAVFFLVMIVKGIELIGGAMLQTSPALNIRMGYVYAIFPVAGILMLLNLCDVTYKSLFTKQFQNNK